MQVRKYQSVKDRILDESKDSSSIDHIPLLHSDDLRRLKNGTILEFEDDSVWKDVTKTVALAEVEPA